MHSHQKSKSKRALSLLFVAVITFLYFMAGDSLAGDSSSAVASSWVDTAGTGSMMTNALEVVWDIVTYSF